MQQKADPSPGIDTSGFVTLHDLSRDCDVRHKQVWYRLKNLIARGELQPGLDFYTADYVDPLHFEWRVEPRKYLELSPRHRVSFDNRQRRIHLESAKDSKSTPPESEMDSIRDQSKTILESEPGSNPLVTKLLEELDHKNETIKDLQGTIRVMTDGFRTFSENAGAAISSLTDQNGKLNSQILLLAAPESADRSTGQQPSTPNHGP